MQAKMQAPSDTILQKIHIQIPYIFVRLKKRSRFLQEDKKSATIEEKLTSERVSYEKI
ncbi:hypothetical protein [Streptococcus azizii]